MIIESSCIYNSGLVSSRRLEHARSLRLLAENSKRPPWKP